jgi:tetratricopeptide (TPR) repeat protein
MKSIIVFSLTVVCFAAFAQHAPPDFDDLARRAAAALQHNPEEAARLYGQAVALRPGWAEGWFYLGASDYQLKRFVDARTALARASELAPDNGAAWAFLGLAESETGDDARALAHIAKGEKLGLPDNPEFISTVRTRAARIARLAGDFTGAIEQLRPLAMSGNRNAAVVEEFGLAALTLRYPSAQIPAAKRDLIDLAGRAAWAFYAKDWKQAEPLFQTLDQRYSAEPGVPYLCGIYYIDRNMDKALDEFRRELQITPSHMMARVQIAILQLREGDPAAPLGPAQEAVKVAPGDLLCRVTLGRALLDLGKVQPAIQEFEAALKIQPDYRHTHFYLSQAYRKAGREADARREQADFIRLKAAGSPTAGAGLPLYPQK